MQITTIIEQIAPALGKERLPRAPNAVIIQKTVKLRGYSLGKLKLSE